MRDYTFELLGKDEYAEKHKNFILNYDIYRDLKLIKVYYADGKCITLDYDIENEKQILKKMRLQLIEYRDIMLSAKKRNFENEKEYNDTKLSLGVVALGCTLLLVKGILFKAVGGVFFAIGSWTTFLEIYANYSNDCDIDDFDKNMLFLENEVKINEVISSDKDFLLDLPIGILKGITCNASGEVIFSINSISKLRYRDIKKLVLIVEQKQKVLKKM